ncbi:hypothetical protein ABZ319_05535 [Nocardia sp. NPDC005978]|uniref:hypothetical protein n=1 Tax=Nocardia sp. NPDC005978 TaxID=3156725 RepID=UPI0033BC852C
MGRRSREAPDDAGGSAERGAPDRDELTAVVAALHFDLAEVLGTDCAPKVFDRVAAALDEQFTSVVTTGQTVDREMLLTGVWSARNTQPGLEIAVSDVREIARSGNLVIVRFTAENRMAGVVTRRVSTAVLVTDGRTHLWRSVHETSTPAES